MPAAWGQRRLDHRQARPVDRGVARRRNPRVVQRVQDQRRPRNAGKEMLGGIVFVIVLGIPIAETRRDKAVVEFIEFRAAAMAARSAVLTAAPGASASRFIASSMER